MSEENKDAKVIQFPGAENFGKNKKKNKKMAFAGLGIIAFLSVFSFMNYFAWQEESTANKIGGRGIADVGGIQSQQNSQEFSNKMASALIENSGSELMKMGRQPSSIESLVFGPLNNQYDISMKNGKLQSIELKGDTEQHDYSPVVFDYNQFLIKSNYRSMLAIDFDRYELTDNKENQDKIKYRLFLKSKEIGSLEVLETPDKKLISLKLDQIIKN